MLPMQTALNSTIAHRFISLFVLTCYTAGFLTFAHAQPLQVVSSFSIMTDLVEQVGGEHVQTYTLIKPETDAHTFEPSAQDARYLANAKLVFINGLAFEPWLDRLTKASGFTGLIVTASNGITPLNANPHEKHDVYGHHNHQHGEYDPHAWQNVINVIIYVENIARALIQADPKRANEYNLRANDFIAQLKALDADILKTIQQIPPERRILVTTHNSFAYFANRYGLTTLSVSGKGNESLSSTASMAQLIEQVRAQRIPAIFLEMTSSPKILEQVIRETDTKLGGKLYADALSVKDAPADTYIKMMRTNVNTLVNALR